MGSDGISFVRALLKLIHNQLRAFVTIDGVVKEVNDDYTCDITINEVLYTGVPITVNIGNQSGIYPLPVIGTNCLVKFRDGNRSLPQIDSFDKIDSYWITAQTKVYIKAPQTEFNGGSKGGLVLVNNLVTRMNLIENQQNEILTILKAVSIPSTPFTFAALFASVTPLNDTTAAQIQSTVITQ